MTLGPVFLIDIHTVFLVITIAGFNQGGSHIPAVFGKSGYPIGVARLRDRRASTREPKYHHVQKELVPNYNPDHGTSAGR